MLFNLCFFFSTVCLQLTIGSNMQIGLKQARMTDDLRLTILRAHNNLRTQLANGQVTDGSKQTLPTGQNIYKFVCLISTGHEFIQNLNRDLLATRYVRPP